MKIKHFSLQEEPLCEHSNAAVTSIILTSMLEVVPASRNKARHDSHDWLYHNVCKYFVKGNNKRSWLSQQLHFNILQ